MIVASTGITYTADDVAHRLAYADLPGTPQAAVFWLARGDRVTDPRFPGRFITGPARVEFVRYPAGLSTTITNPANTVIGA